MATDLLTANPPASASQSREVGQSIVAQTAAVSSGVGRVAERATTKPVASSLISDLIQLTKPRIVVMILVTTVATAMLGAGGVVAAGQLFLLLIATAAVAGSAGAANQVWERVIDQRMTRTASRPVAAGRIGAGHGAMFTSALLLFGCGLLYARFGVVPAAIGLLTWTLYVVVYTPMKTRTAWNTTVGAVAGALPVLIGYTATGGSLMDASGWLLVGVLAAWQYPHFMSIAWMYRRQYAEAGFRMTTTVEPTGRHAGWQSVVGSIVLIACGVVLCSLPGGWLRGFLTSGAVVASTMPMLLASLAFLVEPSDQQARRLLRSSLLVLPFVLAICTLRLFW